MFQWEKKRVGVRLVNGDELLVRVDCCTRSGFYATDMTLEGSEGPVYIPWSSLVMGVLEEQDDKGEDNAG